MALIRSYAAAIAPIEAAEALAQIETSALAGSVGFEKEDVKARLREIEHMAAGEEGRASRRRREKPSAAALAAAGVGVTVIGADGAETIHG